MDIKVQQWQSMVENITDPFAHEIEWTPIAPSGISFKTRYAAMNNRTGSLEFRTALAAKLFSGFPLGIALFIDMIIILGSIGSGKFDFELIIIPFLFSVLFIAIGASLCLSFSKPIIFDRQSQSFYKGKQEEAYDTSEPSNKNRVPFSSIYAIQVITEGSQTNNSSFLSYEINLVLRDKTRVNVVDHGNFEAIQADSKQLGEYLGVPVWGI